MLTKDRGKDEQHHSMGRNCFAIRQIGTYSGVEGEAAGLRTSGLDVAEPVLGDEGVYWTGTVGQGDRGPRAGRGGSCRESLAQAIYHS